MSYKNNKCYWLLVHHFVYFEFGKNGVLLYNTINNKFIKLNEQSPVIEYLKYISENQLCPIVNEIDLSNLLLKSHLEYLKNNFIIDLLPVKDSSLPPIQHVFKANIQSNIKSEKLKGIRATGNKVLRYLSEITIYLTDKSFSLTCDDDYYYNAHEQFVWPVCSKDKNTYINVIKTIKFLEKLPYSSVSLINLVGGNPFLHDDYWLLYDYCNRIKKCCVVNYLYIDEWLDYWLKLKLNENELFEQINISLCITPEKLEKINLNEFLYTLTNVRHAEFRFIIDTRNEFDNYESFISMLNGKDIAYELYFEKDKSICSFYFNENEIVASKPSMEDILARKELNQVQFGKLIIKNNGNVFGNSHNGSYIGNLYINDLESIVYKELTQGSSWLSTRNNFFPCYDCTYRAICPPLSSYEIASQKKVCNK